MLTVIKNIAASLFKNPIREVVVHYIFFVNAVDAAQIGYGF